MGIAHLLQVLGDFHFHIVGNTFVLLDACIKFDKVLLVGFFARHLVKVHHHTKHALDTLAEQHDFLLCHIDGDFRCLHQAARDVAQALVLFVDIWLLLDDCADKSFYLRNEPNEDACVGKVEASVERSQHKTQLGSILSKFASSRHSPPRRKPC